MPRSTPGNSRGLDTVGIERMKPDPSHKHTYGIMQCCCIRAKLKHIAEHRYSRPFTSHML